MGCQSGCLWVLAVWALVRGACGGLLCGCLCCVACGGCRLGACVVCKLVLPVVGCCVGACVGCLWGVSCVGAGAVLPVGVACG